ncbi:hypothetical protein BURK2_00474 [Burkholderiales bacterium]|nr:MAG: Dabb family protein [Burkholderiales bacterium]CAG0956075.1 hypothetical protein BURK2_00474 [Burkholderiales bacterium]
MIRHLVLFKLKPGVTRDDPRVAEAVARMATLPGKLAIIIGWEHGWNFTDRPIAYDYGLNALFATREDLATYLPHPLHQELVVGAREVFDWVVCDYEIPDPT